MIQHCSVMCLQKEGITRVLEECLMSDAELQGSHEALPDPFARCLPLCEPSLPHPVLRTLRDRHLVKSLPL